MKIWVVGVHDGYEEIINEEFYTTEKVARQREWELQKEYFDKPYKAYVFCYEKEVQENIPSI